MGHIQNTTFSLSQKSESHQYAFKLKRRKERVLIMRILALLIMIVMTMKVAQPVGSVLAFIQKADGCAVVHRNLSRPVCRVQTFEYRE